MNFCRVEAAIQYGATRNIIHYSRRTMSKSLPKESGNKILQGPGERRSQKESQTSPGSLQLKVGHVYRYEGNLRGQSVP